MKIRCGFDITYFCPVATPMLFLLSVYPDREHDLLGPQTIRLDPAVPSTEYIDVFGNRVTRLLAPSGPLNLQADFVISDAGEADTYAPDAREVPVEELPHETLVYLLGSRYCDTESLSSLAWSMFGNTPRGWARVQAIVEYAHNRLTFGYQHARNTRTASEGHSEQVGVCRDFAHLAVTLCRCMNIPARYCTGYLGDIGIPPVDAPMDFSAWFEVFLEGRWYTFDARHNAPRIGRIVMARGRDATDVAISTSFGTAYLNKFDVVTDEVVEGAPTSPFAAQAAQAVREPQLGR